MAQHAAGNFLDALSEFHRARVHWFSGDAIRGSLLAQMYIGLTYQSLHLHQAAKYYALAAASLAGADGGTDNLDLVPQALYLAADSDYHQGAWCSAVELLELTFRAHRVFSSEPWDGDHDWVGTGMFDAAVIRAVATKSGSPHLAGIEAMLTRTGAIDWVDTADREFDPWWLKLTAQEFVDQVGDDLGYEPFADSGPRRTIRWRALGVDWLVTADNTFESARAAEAVAAVAQIVAVELARADLGLMPTRVEIRLQLTTDPKLGGRVETEWSNDGRLWVATVYPNAPAGSNSGISAQALGITAAAIVEIALAPGEIFDFIQDAFERGLVDKLAPGIDYVAAAKVVSKDVFESSTRQSGMPLACSKSPSPPEHQELLPPTSPLGEFPASTAMEMIGNRYRRTRELIPYSLAELQADRRFPDVVARMRERGWKDWHILTAIASISINLRLQQMGAATDPVAAEAASKIIATRPEEPSSPRVTLEMLTPEALEFVLRPSMLVTLRHLGLELRQEMPDFPAISRFLGQRYGYWTDDIEHDPIVAA
jgi:hypothetical protein